MSVVGPCEKAGLSGTGVGRINQVTLHRARLVLRWVTVRRYRYM